MKKKIWKTFLGGVFVCLMAFTCATNILAQGQGNPPPHPDPAHSVAGKLVAIGATAMTIETRDSKQEVVNLTAQTIFERNHAAATPASFQVDDHVLAIGTRDASGLLTADRVTGGDQAPHGGGPPPSKGPAGAFVSADLSARSFIVKVRDGSSETVYVTDKTTIQRNRQTATLADFKAGDHIAAVGAVDTAGRFVADRVFGGDEKPANRGVNVNSVSFGNVINADTETGTLTFINQDGVEQTVTVSPQAVVMRNEELAGLFQFRAGDRIQLMGVFDESGRLVVTFISGQGLPVFVQ